MHKLFPFMLNDLSSSEPTWWIDIDLYEQVDQITQQLLLEHARGLPVFDSKRVAFYNDQGNLYGVPPIRIDSPFYYEVGSIGFLIKPSMNRIEFFLDVWIDAPPAPARPDRAAVALQAIHLGHESNRLWSDYSNGYHALPIPRTGYYPLLMRRLLDYLGGRRVIAAHNGTLDCYYYVPEDKLKRTDYKSGSIWTPVQPGVPIFYQRGDNYDVTIASYLVGGEQ